MTTIDELESMISYRLDINYTQAVMPFTYHKDPNAIPAAKKANQYVKYMTPSSTELAVHPYRELVYIAIKLKRLFIYSSKLYPPNSNHI